MWTNDSVASPPSSGSSIASAAGKKSPENRRSGSSIPSRRPGFFRNSSTASLPRLTSDLSRISSIFAAFPLLRILSVLELDHLSLRQRRHHRARHPSEHHGAALSVAGRIGGI